MKRRTSNRLRKSLGRYRGLSGKSSGAKRASSRLERLSIEHLEERRVLAASYFAQAEPAGSVNLQLVPLANVAPGVQEIVTFGVPFTRGSVSEADLADVRILKNGVEIPAFVEQLTPWRSIDDPSIDGQSVRVARIQIPYTFAALSPETITVQWGGPARTLNRATMQDPRIEWHTVTSGSFVASDNVEEPDVLPVLPGSYLSKGMLDARTDPTSSSVAETRDDPAVTDAMTFTGYTEFDSAQKNFFYTTINQNPGITINYKTDPEPWLYDRSSAMYELYMRSGFTTALREAVRSADFYADHLNSSGFFTLKPGDAKYAYNESLAYTYWLLGDNRMLSPISTVVNAHSGTATRWNPNLSFWTERNVGYKLLANEMAYEVTGGAAFKNSVQTIIGDLVWHQNGAGGQLPSNRVDGGLYHFGWQHDASEVDDPNVIIASSWMSVLIVDPMVRAYGVWQNPQIADFIVRMGNFEKAASKTDANGQFDGITRYPDYLMRADGTSENRSDTDVQHAMDVGGVAAWATYFAELRGTPDPSLRQLANDLYATYDVGVNFWTRPGGTNYNVSPPRRYTWEYKNSASFSWALTGSDQPGQPGTLQFNAANYSVNENQGTIAVTVTRNGGSTGAVSVHYAATGGTATAGSDFTAVSGTLTFADGETTKTFNVPIVNDAAVENAETFTLTLSDPTGGASLASPATATVTIESDDATNQPITAAFQQGVNGYAGTTDAEISTQYGQYNGGNGTTTVDGSQIGVYHLSGDNGYTTEGLIRFGDLGITSNAIVSSATLTLSVDTWFANPTIRGYYLQTPWTTIPGSDLSWLRTGLGQTWAAPGALGQGTDVISGKSFVLPGITARGEQTITVNLDPAVVQSWIDNPNANQGILLVNETTGAVVRINTSENTTASLRPKLNITYTVGGQAPQPGALQFSGATYSVNENGGTATITVTRTGGSDGAVSVHYATSNGTATAGSDYTATSGTLNFAAGETSKTFTIPILNDTLVEGNETVNLSLSSPTGGATLGSQATAALTIVSDDVAQAGTLQFSGATYSVNENGGAATITVTRTGGSDGAVSVHYATSNGTATAGSDYTATSGTLNFAAGETSKTFTIPILNDTLVEGNETVNLTLSNPTGGATLGGQATAALTIISDDVAQPGTLQFSGATYSVNENGGTATITVTRTGGSDGAVSVHYATSNGTATAGSDYTATSGTLNFAAGETSKTFTIPILNDTLVEGNETVNLTLSNPTGGATLGSQATAALTIVSDDVAQAGTLQFSGATYSVNENGGTATITVTRTGGSDGAVSVHYATSNGTATAGSDYTAVSGTLNFAAGETSKTFTIPILNDTLVEGNETVNLTLSNPAGGATLGSQATATLTIVSDDTNSQPGTVTLQQGVNGYNGTTDLSISTLYTQYTGGNGTTFFDSSQAGVYQTTGSGSYFMETLIKFSDLGIPAGATVSGASLTLAVDTWSANPTVRGYYVLAPWSGAPGSNETQVGWLHRGGGQNWTVPGALGQGTDVVAGKNFVIPGIAARGLQTITINLDPAVVQSWLDNPNANQGILLVNETPGAIVRINASENSTVSTRPKLNVSFTTGTTPPQPGALQFSNATYSVNETGGTATITVTRTGGSDGAVSVHYATSNGTATAGSDYTAASGTLNFAAGETSKTFTIPILNDALVEGNETVNLTLSSPTGGATLGSQTTAALTIISDDVAQAGALQFSGATYSVNEAAGMATITVTRTGGSNGAVSVHYATSNGTATAGSDYTATSGTLNFAAGETSKTFTIPILNDALVEGNETVNLTLSSPTGGATLGSQATAALTIISDDVAQPGTLQFSNANYTVNEAAGTATITVTRTGGSDGAVSVHYATSNGTATAGSDYTAASGTLNFAAGETSKTFTIPILNDTAVEGDETVNLTLSNPAGGATLGGRATAVLTIQSDDAAGQPGAFQFNASSYSLTENGGVLTVTVNRVGGTSGAVSVHYATSNGTATAGADYTAASGTLSFADGEGSKTFTVAVLDDSAAEGAETVTLALTNATGGATLGDPATATFTIVDNDSASGVSLPAGFTQSVVATGISSGTALAVAPDGRIFVLEQGGAVRVIKNGALLATPAFTVPTVAESERGLLGITFDPNFNANHFVYVYYTVGGPSPNPAHNRVSRFTLSGDTAAPGSEQVLLELPETTFRIHNGGALKFGADGKLYIAVGNDVDWNNSQDLTKPFGKILRINADGSIPTDNPFFNQTTGVNRAIWAIGLRNPYTFDVQPGTGLMYINDVGESSWEEINRGTAGANYGWPEAEGYTTDPRFQSPVYAYAHGTGPDQGFAIVGGAFYNPASATFPSQFVGKYFFMDYVNGWIDYIDPASPSPKTPSTFATNIPTRFDGGPVDLEVGADGALYYLNRLGGGVFKIQFTAPPPSGAFTNVTSSSGVGAIIDQKYQQTPDWWLSGEHLVDLDNDGDLDLYLSNHGGGSVVALNDGHGVFTRVPDGTFPDTEIHQMYDINEDGKVDLSMTFQDGGGRWWTNNSTPGSVNFSATNVTRETNTSRSQVMLDFNGDGKVDWLRSAPPGLVVDLGNGAGGFAEDSLTFAIPGTTSNDNASFLPADFDGDGDVDLLVLTGGNYDGTPGKTALWRNNGNLTFTDITAGSGIPLDGVIAKGIGDFDQDGDTDFIALENRTLPPAIYLNDGHGHFTKKAGAISGISASGLDYSFWGTAVSTDFDNDGIADIIMDGKYYLLVLRGTGGGNFTYMNTAWGIRNAAAATLDDGLSFGDVDGDGDLDIIGYEETFPTRTLNVYRNDLAAHNWLNVRPVGLAGDKGAAGAKISIYAAGTNQLLWYEQVATYDFQSAASYYSYGETERHFGLGNRTAVDVVVEFAGSGRVTRINNVAANQTLRVLASAGNAPSFSAAAIDTAIADGAGGGDPSGGDSAPAELSDIAFDASVGANRESAGSSAFAFDERANSTPALDAAANRAAAARALVFAERESDDGVGDGSADWRFPL